MQKVAFVLAFQKWFKNLFTDTNLRVNRLPAIVGISLRSKPKTDATCHVERRCM